MASASGVDHSDAAHLVDQERRRAPLNMIANIGVSAAGHYGLRKQGLSPAATICRPGHVLSAQIDALNHPAATTDTHVSDRQAIFEAPFPTPQFAVVRQSPLRLLGVQGMRWIMDYKKHPIDSASAARQCSCALGRRCPVISLNRSGVPPAKRAPRRRGHQGWLPTGLAQHGSAAPGGRADASG